MNGRAERPDDIRAVRQAMERQKKEDFSVVLALPEGQRIMSGILKDLGIGNGGHGEGQAALRDFALCLVRQMKEVSPVRTKNIVVTAMGLEDI